MKIIVLPCQRLSPHWKVMVPVDDSHFTVSVNVAVSRQFLAWVFALGEGVKIMKSQSVVEQMKEEAERLMRQYIVNYRYIYMNGGKDYGLDGF